MSTKKIEIMKQETLYCINKIIYAQEDTMPYKENDPELFKTQSAELKELKKIKKWLLSIKR